MKFSGLLFLLLFLSLSSFAQFDMPAFKKVINSFSTQYSFHSFEGYIKFFRKKEGWYVAKINYETLNQYNDAQLFWSKEKKAYLKLKGYLPADTDTNGISETINDYLTQINWSYDEYDYKRVKYYGYPGWDWDVINDTTVETAGNDTLLESKARAYNSYALGFLATRYNYFIENNDPDRAILHDSDKISKSRIDKFIFYESKALQAYTKLFHHNAAYLTKVGNIKIKLANEYVFAGMELLMAGDSGKALAFAQKADYPDSLLKLWESALKELAPNSILLNYGDNDTYPVWYLQNVKNIRPDVISVNYSLAAYNRYLLFLDKNLKGHLFSVKDTTYLKKNFIYSVFHNDSTQDFTLDVGTFLSNLQKNFDPYDSGVPQDVYYDRSAVREYYATKLFFELPHNRRTKPFKISNHLFLNDYILLDIINTNKNKNIYLTFQPSYLEQFLEKKGNLFELKL